MARPCALTGWTILSALLLLPTTLWAQTGAIRVVKLRPTLAVDACAVRTAETSGVMSTTLRALTMDTAVSRGLLAHVQDSLSALAPAHPSDVDLQFELAVVLGARTEVEEGRDKLKTAGELLRQIRLVLDLDPSHPGAQYLLGRLNAAVMRMNPMSRFVATRMLGGSALSGASWQEARRLLESAAEGDPCSPDMQYELARLYHDRGERTLAVKRLQRLLRLQVTDAHGQAVLEEGLDLLQSLGSP